jgi:CRP-like cAMP-binding protein
MTNTERAAEHLLNNPSFSGLNPSEAREFLRDGTPRSFAVGEVLLKEGAVGTSLIIVTAGEVEVSRGGRRLALLGPGDTLGEMSLVDPGPRSATVTARRSGSLIEVDRTTFVNDLEAGGTVSIKALQCITETVFKRLVEVNNQVETEMVTPRGNVFGRLWRGITTRRKGE